MSTERMPKQLLVLTPVEKAAFPGEVVTALCGHDCIPSPRGAIALARNDVETTVVCHNCVDKI